LTQTIPFAGAWRAGTVSSDDRDDLDEAEEAGAEADDAGAEAGADFAEDADLDEADSAADDLAAPPLTTTMDEIFEIVDADTPAFERSETDA